MTLASAAASLVVKATVIAVLAVAGARLARRSRAAVRHVWLAAAIAILLLLPIASLAAPSVTIRLPIARTIATAAAPVDGVSLAASPESQTGAAAAIAQTS
ncbi:MAG TPA: hypothetical protein VGL62_16485, partial [Vicinamibacterales bacterium]